MLRHILTLENRSQSPDHGGGWQESWLKLGQHWASIQPSNGAEVNSASRQAQRITHRIMLRYAGSGSSMRPRADQRFRFKDRIYAIRAVFDGDSRGRTLTCLCEEGAIA